MTLKKIISSVTLSIILACGSLQAMMSEKFLTSDTQLEHAEAADIVKTTKHVLQQSKQLISFFQADIASDRLAFMNENIDAFISKFDAVDMNARQIVLPATHAGITNFLKIVSNDVITAFVSRINSIKKQPHDGGVPHWSLVGTCIVDAYNSDATNDAIARFTGPDKPLHHILEYMKLNENQAAYWKAAQIIACDKIPSCFKQTCALNSVAKEFIKNEISASTSRGEPTDFIEAKNTLVRMRIIKDAVDSLPCTLPEAVMQQAIQELSSMMAKTRLPKNADQNLKISFEEWRESLPNLDKSKMSVRDVLELSYDIHTICAQCKSLMPHPPVIPQKNLGQQQSGTWAEQIIATIKKRWYVGVSPAVAAGVCCAYWYFNKSVEDKKDAEAQ